MTDNAACPVCNSRDLVDHRDLRECRTCTHLFQWPPTITAKYDAAYVAKYAGYPLGEISHLRLGFLRAFVDRGRLLDVGHCRGDFVRAASRGGFESFGYDIHGVAVGVPTIPKLCDGQPWDVVTFFDSLEHFASLDCVRDVARRTKWIVVACPRRPLDFPVNREWKHYRPGEHLHYPNARALATLFPGHLLAKESSVEDTIRGSRGRATNIATYVFKRRS